MAIGITDGSLNKYGYYKPIYGTKTEVHPDTGFVFENFKLSEYNEACKLVCRAHELFYGIHSIGWDIAFTDKGPVFIEGNDNWEISLMQIQGCPLREKWKQAIQEGE